jgi:cell division protein FtsI/penicillin-binding protein 2
VDRTKRFLVSVSALFLLAAQLAAGDSAFDSACKKALGKRRGAVILIALPDGKVLDQYGGAMTRRRFYGSSIYKPLAAYALLKEGAIKPEEKLTTSRRVLIERYGVTLESRYEEDGKEVNLAQAIAVSSNSYFYRMGARLEPETLLKYYREFGLGACVRPPATAEEKAEFPAHGGKCVRASAQDLIPYLKKLALDPSPEMAIVRDAMRLAITEGTGQGANVEGMQVCGKTGWLNGAGLFIAFEPREKPALGIIVAIPGATGSEAATVAGDILRSGAAGPISDKK